MMMIIARWCFSNTPFHLVGCERDDFWRCFVAKFAVKCLGALFF
jgi:hypothetical protein